jgi:hypothetical protein
MSPAEAQPPALTLSAKRLIATALMAVGTLAIVVIALALGSPLWGIGTAAAAWIAGAVFTVVQAHKLARTGVPNKSSLIWSLVAALGAGMIFAGAPNHVVTIPLAFCSGMIFPTLVAMIRIWRRAEEVRTPPNAV